MSDPEVFLIKSTGREITVLGKHHDVDGNLHYWVVDAPSGYDNSPGPYTASAAWIDRNTKPKPVFFEQGKTYKSSETGRIAKAISVVQARDGSWHALLENAITGGVFRGLQMNFSHWTEVK